MNKNPLEKIRNILKIEDPFVYLADLIKIEHPLPRKFSSCKVVLDEQRSDPPKIPKER